MLLKISPWPPKCSLKKLFTSSSLSLSVCCADHDFIFLEIGNAKEKYENSVETHQQYLCHYSVIIPSLSSKKSVWEAECPELEGLLQRHYNVCSTITNLLKRKQRYLFFLLLLCKAAFKTFYEERLKCLKNKHTTKLQITKEEISAASCIAESLSQPHSAKFAITMIFFFFPAENEARIVSLWQQETLKTLLP